MSATASLPDVRSGSDAQAILAAVVFGARDFMNRPDWDGVLGEFLERLGLATASSEVRLFENDAPRTGQPLTTTLRARWASPGASTRSIDESPHLSFSANGCARWEALLAGGRNVIGITAELPAGEQATLRSQGILSVAVVPIFVADRWFGFLGLSDCERPRRWSEAEIDALSAAASFLGSAWRRREMEERIRSAATQERLGDDIARALSARGQSLDEMLERCGALITHHIGAAGVAIWTASGNDDVLTVSASTGPLAGLTPVVRIGEHTLGTVARRQEPVIWRDGTPELWPGCAGTLVNSGIRGAVAVPLYIADDPVGLMVMVLGDAPTASQVEALVGVSAEIALAIEHGRARSALDRSEDRYRRLFEATVEGICIHDGRRLLDCNPSLAAMTGWEVNDIIGHSPFEFLHPRCHADVRAKIAANYEKPYEAEMLHRDGSVFPVEIKGTVFTLDGERLRLTSIRDITQRKAAEVAAVRLAEERAAREAAEETQRRAQFLADASRVLASSFDTTTTLNQLAHLSVPVLADSCVVSFLEDGVLRPVAIVNADPRHPLLPAHSLESVAALIGAGRHEAMIDQCADEMMFMSVPVVLGGETIGAIVFGRAPGGRRYRPEDLALAQELSSRAALAIQGARSYEQAQAATRARDEMLAIVAHDLRNPLNTIYMGGTLALELSADQPPSPARTQLEVIVRSATTMNRLIQDLLDATRVQSGQLTLERAAADPAAVVGEALELLRPLALSARLDLVAEVDDVCVPIHVDRVRINQVLSNLIGNAIKFTPAGGHIVLAFSARSGEPHFRVTDDGPGIAAEQLPHVFGRFWQGRRTDHRGLGLGLSIARGIVEAHGGRIWVESTPGKGTTFHFTVAAA